MTPEYYVSTIGSSVPAPEGNHTARLVGVIDLGIQLDHFEKKPRHKPQVLLTFELVNEAKDDDNNLVISRRYNVTFGPQSRLREAAEALLGAALGRDPVNIYALLGRPCMVQVI